MLSKTKNIFIILFCLATTFCQSGADANLDLRSRVHEVVLDNGMTFLLLRRKEGAPVFSVQLKVKVGNIEEEPGSSGLAHFFEHMAFKGTDKIGTQDFSKEQPILDEVLKVGTEIALKKKAGKPPEEYADLVKRLKALEAKENRHIVKNEFMQIYQKNGGRDINASTSNDFTTYYVSMPTNKLELWAYLESERLKNRVFREFFTEVDVVAEERRMRIDNSPDGRLYEAFTAAAFDRSPYKIHPIGYAKDIETYTPAEAERFYSRYYIPSRMVAVLVGNFNEDEAETLIRKYFSDIPKKPDEPKAFASEIFDSSYPRRVTLEEKGAQSRFYLGYHRPAHPHEDDIVFDVVQDILCEGRTSRLYRRLVIKDRSVSQVGCYSAVPGARLDSLFTFTAVPIGNHKNDEIQKIIKEEIALLVKEGPSESELQVVKNKNEARLVYSLESNSGLASMLAFYQSLTGDWRYLYHFKDRIQAMQASDIQRVAKTYFVDGREISAFLEEKK